MPLILLHFRTKDYRFIIISKGAGFPGRKPKKTHDSQLSAFLVSVKNHRTRMIFTSKRFHFSRFLQHLEKNHTLKA
jgi:hypothetical protein